MRLTVNVKDADMKVFQRMTGLSKKGPAVEQVLADALRMQRRAEMTDKIMSGEWRFEFNGFEENRAAAWTKEQEREKLMRPARRK